MVLYIKAWHIIAMVAWFAGLFYLPRLFVYHVSAQDSISLERFKVMERRLYYAITWPAALITSVLGLVLFSYQTTYYAHAAWMHAKLCLVGLLWVFHLWCGHYVRQFASDGLMKSTRFFRIFNEIPTILLIGIVMMIVVRPF